MNNLKRYLKDNLIKYDQISENVVKIDEKTYQVIYPDGSGRIFDDVFELTCADTEEDNYIFMFGDLWYWTPKGSETDPQLNDLRYIGNADIEPPYIPWLGIHGKYEILNGSREYSDWCKKAKFLKCDTLGLCELNTLAGVIQFQDSCVKGDIKPIIGATYIVRNVDRDLHYRVKIYAKDESGWQTLLRVNKHVNVDNNGFISEDAFWEDLRGVVTVLDPKYIDYQYISDIVSTHRDLYYQLDSVSFEDVDRDVRYLDNLAQFIRSDIKPILIQDSYYLDREDHHIKAKLNQISSIREFRSCNQFFKTFDDIYEELDRLFLKDSKTFDHLLERSTQNLLIVAKECDFKIDTSNFYLPEYRLTEEQSEKFSDKDDLFLYLIEEGLKKKVHSSKIDKYRERVDEELRVINMGDKLIDYFLILWDIIDWCHTNDILVGVGRGSSGGCLIAYLLDIVKIDPIEYNLLFERFLNENRVKKSLPDIDSDFEGLRRDDIKSYMESRFGRFNVCSVGTYANMKMKMAIFDLSKMNNVDVGTARMMTSIMSDLDNDGTKWSDIFKLCTSSQKLKTFVKKNSNIVNDSKLILMQPRSSSVHACATIVTPSDKTIFEWFPIRKMKNKNDEDILVSEWEGFYLDKTGFLKEDILGILQLDKFAFIRKLVRENKGENIDIYNINMKDRKTFDYFHNGWNEDVFQFGTSGLKKYSRQVKPDTIEELIAMNALYRPGAMKSNAHNDYVDIKFGKKEPEYDHMLEEVTVKTYGLYLYQEQTMLAAQKLGGMSLSEADMMRKVMLGRGKKQQADKFYIYMNLFLDGAEKNGCDRKEAEKIWEKLEAFAGYGFNKCVSGDTRFKRLGFNKQGSASFIPTIEEMWLIKNEYSYAKKTNHIDLHKKYNKHGYGIGYSLNENNRLIKNKIVDIRFVGFKPVYKVTMNSGEYIEVTDNHKFPTTNGEKQLKDINIDKDLLFVEEGYDHKKIIFTFTDHDSKHEKLDNPFEYKFKKNSEKGKEGFQKRDSQATKLTIYKKNHKKNFCEICEDDHRRLEVHHKNGFHGDNRLENLITVCPSCHKKEHYKLGRRKQGDKGLLTRTEKIISIDYTCEKMVFDVEMADPYHTFVVDNGIVTSNSHAAAYGVTGYVSQYLKCHYPIEFWTCAFSFIPSGKKDEKIPSYISEIHQTGDIKVLPPDINFSGDGFTPNFKNNSIYWSLNSVTQCGEKAVEQLVREKRDKGEYFSFEEFMTRNVIKGSKVTKQVIENLIMSGAFDEIENISNYKDRYQLIEKYRDKYKIKIDKTKDIFTLNRDLIMYNWWWSLQQKRLCGFAMFDFRLMCESYLDTNDRYMDAISIQEDENEGSYISTGGYINDIIVRQSKKGEYADIILDNNFEFITIKFWQDSWELAKDIITDKNKCILLVNGRINYNKFSQQNIVVANDNSDILVLE